MLNKKASENSRPRASPLQLYTEYRGTLESVLKDQTLCHYDGLMYGSGVRFHTACRHLQHSLNRVAIDHISNYRADNVGTLQSRITRVLP